MNSFHCCHGKALTTSEQRKRRGRIPRRERVARAARAKPKHTFCPNQAAPSCLDHSYTQLPRLKCNWIKVNGFAGLLNIFYIQGSTKINVKMMSQNEKDEFIYVSRKTKSRQCKTKIGIDEFKSGTTNIARQPALPLSHHTCDGLVVKPAIQQKCITPMFQLVSNITVRHFPPQVGSVSM